LKIKILFACLLAFLSASQWVFADGKRILILMSDNLPPFQQAIDGFKKGLSNGQIPTEIEEHNVAEGPARILPEAEKFYPDLIYAVGSAATKFAREKFPDHPVIFSMVLYPSMSNIETVNPGTNITGVAMDIPLDRQFETILKIVPTAQKIAVLYNPKETGSLIAQADELCRQRSLQLVAIPVNSAGDVPRALDGAERKADVLWSVADATVFNGKMPEYILQYTLQHNLPFMGLSTNFVEAGALFGLSQDYTDMGMQAAELAVHVFAGAKPGEIPVALPRKIQLWLNLRAADEIGLKINQDVIQSATRIVK
jgi:putative ABC transport system substrate-binding protein